MQESNILFFLQVICILLALGVIMYLLRLYHTIKLEKRIAPFAIGTKELNEKSFFDKNYDFINTMAVRLTKLLSYSKVLSDYAKVYTKYISFEEKDKKTGMYYIAIKFMLGFLGIFLSFLTVIFRGQFLSIFTFLLLFLIGFFIPDIYLKVEYHKKRKRIEEELLKAIIIMNNAFGSGSNIMQATEIVKNELDGPIQDEFKKIYLDITYGLNLEVVFNRFYERVKIEDAKYITTALALLNKTGGDIVKIFSRLEQSILDKKSLKNELNSLTASSRFVFKMLVFLPFIFSLIIFVLNPSYFVPLFTSPLGILALFIIVVFYILYIIIIKKLLMVQL